MPFQASRDLQPGPLSVCRASGSRWPLTRHRWAPASLLLHEDPEFTWPSTGLLVSGLGLPWPLCDMHTLWWLGCGPPWGHCSAPQPPSPGGKEAEKERPWHPERWVEGTDLSWRGPGTEAHLGDAKKRWQLGRGMVQRGFGWEMFWFHRLRSLMVREVRACLRNGEGSRKR